MSEENTGQDEFATRQAQPADESAVLDKLDQQDEAAGGPVVVSAADIDSLVPEPGPDVGEKSVQARIDKETEAGLRGIETDPTPNSNYTVEGVVSGAPTPETDPSLRDDIRAARRIDGPAPL